MCYCTADTLSIVAYTNEFILYNSTFSYCFFFTILVFFLNYSFPLSFSHCFSKINLGVLKFIEATGFVACITVDIFKIVRGFRKYCIYFFTEKEKKK